MEEVAAIMDGLLELALILLGFVEFLVRLAVFFALFCTIVGALLLTMGISEEAFTLDDLIHPCLWRLAERLLFPTEPQERNR